MRFFFAKYDSQYDSQYDSRSNSRNSDGSETRPPPPRWRLATNPWAMAGKEGLRAELEALPDVQRSVRNHFPTLLAHTVDQTRADIAAPSPPLYCRIKNRAKELGVSEDDLYRARFHSRAKLVDHVVEIVETAEKSTALSVANGEGGEAPQQSTLNAAPTLATDATATAATTKATSAVGARKEPVPKEAAPKQKRNLLSCCFVKPRSSDAAADHA